MKEVNLQAERDRVDAAQAKHDAAIAKLDAVIAPGPEDTKREAALRSQRDVAQAGLDASRAAHREALLREHVGRQELIAMLAKVTEERDALIAKYEPGRVPKAEDPRATSDAATSTAAKRAP